MGTMQQIEQSKASSIIYYISYIYLFYNYFLPSLAGFLGCLWSCIGEPIGLSSLSRLGMDAGTAQQMGQGKSPVHPL